MSGFENAPEGTKDGEGLRKFEWRGFTIITDKKFENEGTRRILFEDGSSVADYGDVICSGSGTLIVIDQAGNTIQHSSSSAGATSIRQTATVTGSGSTVHQVVGVNTVNIR